jgi:predicted Fe-Mo cluster-binding NifX family protein
MKIAFTAKGTTWEDNMDPRFGRTDYILVYDEETGTLTGTGNREVDGVTHGAGTQTAQKLFELGPQPDYRQRARGNAGAATASEQEIYIGAGE